MCEPHLVELPPPEWWNEKAMPADVFFCRLWRYSEERYDRTTIDFTHDVFFRGVVIGQAARVEHAFGTLQLAVVSIFQGPAMYGVIDREYELRPKHT